MSDYISNLEIGSETKQVTVSGEIEVDLRDPNFPNAKREFDIKYANSMRSNQHKSMAEKMLNIRESARPYKPGTQKIMPPLIEEHFKEKVSNITSKDNIQKERSKHIFKEIKGEENG